MGMIAKYALGLVIWPILALSLIKEKVTFWPTLWTLVGILKALDIITTLVSGDDMAQLTHDVPVYIILGLWANYKFGQYNNRKIF
ncbi:MAG: hypothetical protein JWN90_8 [Parcubacteria group bacterium]|nr:hypothetical protein [Parcubacteria group bacterium]